MKKEILLLFALSFVACSRPKVETLPDGSKLILQEGFDPNWDTRKTQLRNLLREEHGMGLLFALERESDNTILFSFTHEGGSLSKHRLIVSYVDPTNNKNVELLDLFGGQGTGGSIARLLQMPYKVPKSVNKVNVFFAVGVSGSKSATALIPDQGNPRKVYFLHIPES